MIEGFGDTGELYDELDAAKKRIEQLEKDVKDWQRMYREAVIQKEMIFRHQYDHIEKLEAALREIADGQRDADKSYAELVAEIRIEARKALEGKENE